MRFVVFFFLLIVSIVTFGCNGTGSNKGSVDPVAMSFSFDLKFTAKNTCSGPFPEVSLKSVPPGTETLEFSMIDLDYNNYDHGHGQVKYAGNDTLREGELGGLMGPCMERSGTHRYKITIKALSKDNQVLGVAVGTKSYTKS